MMIYIRYNLLHLCPLKIIDDSYKFRTNKSASLDFADDADSSVMM